MNRTQGLEAWLSDMLDELVKRVAAIPDKVTRAQTATQVMGRLRRTSDALSALRPEGIQQLLSQGQRQSDIARRMGISQQRLAQMIEAGVVRADGAFLGTGPVTVAIGGKLEAGRTDDQKQPVVSDGALGAFNVLAELARAVSLDATYEIVPPPGIVNLNRDNLLVLTSPKLVPVVQQVLDTDPFYGFAQSQDGLEWVLVDRKTGTEYRSPYSSGEPVDYAYLGRLPRPDRRGTFLYLAGIHSPGTFGAAVYLAEHMPELYKQLGAQRRFSTLLRCEYDPETRKIIRVGELAPLQVHEGVA